MSKAFFSVKGPTGQAFNYEMDKNFITIGRESSNDIPLEDKFSSKKHSKVTRHPDGTFRVTDMESHNGTKVNGQKIEEHILRPGDIIEVGHSQVTFLGVPSAFQAPYPVSAQTVIPQQMPPSPVPVYTPQPVQPQYQMTPQQAGMPPPAVIQPPPVFETPVQRMEEEIVPMQGQSGRLAGLAKLFVPFAILGLIIVAGLLLRNYLFVEKEKVVGKYMKEGEYKIYAVDPFMGTPSVTDSEVVKLTDLGRKIEIGVTALKRGNADVVMNTANGMKFILRIAVLANDEPGGDEAAGEVLSSKQREEKAKILLQQGNNCMANNELYDARSFYKQVMEMLEPVGANKDYTTAEEKYFETDQALESIYKEKKNKVKAFINSKDYDRVVDVCNEIKAIFHDPKDRYYMEANNMIERFKPRND